jgi:putative pyruvate formate lyase activating enzyme
MHERRSIKSYFTHDGRVHLVDPGPEHLPFIRLFQPDFKIDSNPPPSGYFPNLVKTKTVRISLSHASFHEADDDLLWQIHADGVAGRLQDSRVGTATLLDIKIELARRSYLHCNLCSWECGVNRFRSLGRCGLKERAYVIEPFLHIAEESMITPSATLKLFQCALHCTGCQSWEIIHRKQTDMLAKGRPLDQSIWKACAGFSGAATIEFVGGNPSESLYPILTALSALPEELSRKPIVWNDHGYTMPVAYDLLNGVVDVYLPDFKGCDQCVEKISKVPGYWASVTKGIDCMLRQQARIIVRLLILPGHLYCCHGPSLEWLSKYRERLWVSLIEFIPDYRALQDSELNRPTSEEEMASAKKIMKCLGLRDVEYEPENFWNT